MKLQYGDIILCKGNSIISKIIKWFTNSDYSHVAMVISDDGMHLYHTNYNMSTKLTHMMYSKGDYDVYRVIGEYDHKLLHRFMRENIGNKYDLTDIFKIIIRINTDDMDREYICSELIRKAYSYSGIELVDKDIKIATPQDIASSKYVLKIN